MSTTESGTSERVAAAARHRFATEGYAATSLTAVAADAGVPADTLHHHFAGKADLFSLVFEDQQARIARTVADATARHSDPWDAARAALRAFLDATLDPGVQRIALLDAPVALGPELMRALEAPYGLALIRRALREIREQGGLLEHDPDSLARLLFGATCEAAMCIARAPDQVAERDRMELELTTLVEGLRQ